jgi:ribonuclease G
MTIYILVETQEQKVRFCVVSQSILTETGVILTRIEETLHSIFKGIVRHIIPGGYFLDVGTKSFLFLPIEKGLPSLKEGESVIVQVTREAFQDLGKISAVKPGKKSALATRKISLANRFLTYNPFKTVKAVSRKITDLSVKERLLSLPVTGCFTFRQASCDLSNDSIFAEADKLTKLYETILDKALSLKKGILWQAPTPLELILRDWPDSLDCKIIINDHHTFQKIQTFLRQEAPFLLPKCSLPRETEKYLFSYYGIEDIWEDLFSPLVKLKNGGNILIESTATAVTIDINQGSSDAITTLLEAADVIAEQIHLRHLSGNILIDVMDVPSSIRKQFETNLRKKIQENSIQTQIMGWSHLGFLELRRERRHPPLSELWNHTHA